MVVNVNEEVQLEKPRVGGNVGAVEDCDPNTGKDKANFTLEQATKAHTLEQATKAQRESRSIALLFLLTQR